MASTYVNDLRLNEMATGDQSGSWGTVTNTNLELIGEAFSYGTENIITNADSHTTTISDGATAPGRSMFLKYTGTLDSACTITIGPNTVNKMWFIENATTGSQNIIISQGSGANITIAAGQTKAVYSDGAGAGAAFVDAFAALDVGSLAIAGTLVTSTAAEINILDGVTATAAEINILDGVTATAAEINILDGVTATAAEINYVDGVTSNIQTQLDTKGVVAGSGSIVTTGALNSGSITSGFGTINNGSSTITTTGTVATGAITAGGNITRGGTVIQDGTITDTGDFTIDVAGDIILDADGTAVMFKDAGTEYGRIFNSGTDLVIKSIISNRDMIFQGNDGGTGITALTLDMSEAGAATFNAIVNAPNFNTTSDVRLKDNIRTFESAMDVVSQLRGVRFAWKETGVETVGLIAQEVEKVLPELIGTNADTGLKSVSYSNMVAVLIEAVKELKAEIEELKKR
jgi:hypothetical protein